MFERCYLDVPAKAALRDSERPGSVSTKYQDRYWNSTGQVMVVPSTRTGTVAPKAR